MSTEKVDLQALVAQFSSRDLPPVAQWNPISERTIDMRIDHNGTWYYNGSAIERARMVALFSTILRREGERYFLVTPHEKLAIEVENVPFVVQLMEVTGDAQGQCLEFTDNVGNVFVAGNDHPLWTADYAGQLLPYVMVRENLPGLLSRAVYYQLAELVIERDDHYGVWSDGVFFPLQ